jgi:hypothetical protein
MTAPIICSDNLRVILRGQITLISGRMDAGLPVLSALLNAAYLAERIERAEGKGS